MSDIPTGAVTFLFTDIEGSTRLSQEFPETLPAALGKYNSIMHEAIESHNGFVFKITGDAFCCAFANGDDAVKAAVMAQKNLSTEKWDDAVIKIRIGIHSGNAEWNGSNYMGYITLARTQRVMACAYGEQIIVSNNTYELLKEKFPILNQQDSFASQSLPGGKKDNESSPKFSHKISYKDLGERRLKDLIQPVRLYQVVAEGLRESFPPLKTLDARPNNLPVQLTSFIGRETDIKEIKAHLLTNPILSLLGPGGTGKTRLALQVGAEMIDDFTNGVWFVELASLSDPLFVVVEIASVFKLSSDGKIEIFEIIKNYFREKEFLLILDNCEHLIEECAKVSEELLKLCPGLKILASSREPLHISGEITYAVPTLSLPDTKKKSSLEDLLLYESVRLFIDRALTVKPDFKVTNSNAPALAKLCYEIDGIPLAIELAAARVRVLPVEKILERLKDRFNLLTGGKRTVLPRQQTLRALIDWSYDLLSEKEKLLLQRLSVFLGGFTLDAGEEICADEFIEKSEILDLLSNLLDKSLVKVYESDYELRYTMLETIRQYGEEKLIATESKSGIQKKQFEFFYRFVEDSEAKLTGSQQREWIKKIDSEYENIRECLKWSLKNNPESTLKMSVALGKFWEVRSYFFEGLNFLQTGLQLSNSVELILKAKVFYWTGFFSMYQGKYSESKKYLNESLEIFREIKDKSGQAVALMALATITLFEGDYENSKNLARESLLLSHEINNKSFIAANLRTLAVSMMHLGEHDDSRKNYDESLSIYRELNDSVQLAKIIGNIGALEYLRNNYEDAILAFEESLSLRNELGDRQGIAISLNNLGTVYYMKLDFDKSLQYLEDSLLIIKELGDRRIYVTPTNTIGNIANETNDFSKAIKMFSESIVISIELGDKYSFAKGIEGFANSYIGLKNYQKACVLSGVYISLLTILKTNLIPAEIARIEEIKNILKSNLNESEYEKYWTEGEAMTVEEAMNFALAEKQ